VDAVVLKTELDDVNRTLTTAQCNVPTGLGGILTVGPGRQRSLRHPTRFEPSCLALNAML